MGIKSHQVTARNRPSSDNTSQSALAVVGALYDAALDESLWPEALQQLKRLTGSQAATFWVLDAADATRHPTFVYINFDRNTVAEYLAGMSRLDPTVRYLFSHPHAAIVHDGMLGEGGDEDTRRYLEWHERGVETRFRLVAQTELYPGLQAGVALHRARKVGRYQPAEVERFAILHGHLRRALAIGARLGSLGRQQQLTADVLDRRGVAVVLLDLQGRVVFLNRAAEELESQHDGLRVSQQGIRLANESENRSLQCLIARTVDSLERTGRATCEAMPASRLSGKRPYGICVTAMSRPPTGLTAFRAAVCLLINDPERRTGPTVPHLQALFRMTRAEALLATHLADGEPLRTAAHSLGITYGTARARLTQLFQKTNTRSQSALIRLLLTVIDCA